MSAARTLSNSVGLKFYGVRLFSLRSSIVVTLVYVLLTTFTVPFFMADTIG